MSQLRSLRLGDAHILVEVDPSTAPTLVPLPRWDPAVPEGSEPVGFEQRVADAAALIRSTISSIAATSFEAARATDASECSVEISLAFKGEVTPVPVLVKAASEASLKVVLKWTR